MIKKADIFLLIALIVIGGFISFGSVAGSVSGDTVLVSVNGEPYGTYDLSKDQEVVINSNGHTNHITIKSGTVQMSSSDCRNQVCVNTGSISMTHEKIVCLPNKVVVEIRSSNGGGEYDVISG